MPGPALGHPTAVPTVCVCGQGVACAPEAKPGVERITKKSLSLPRPSGCRGGWSRWARARAEGKDCLCAVNHSPGSGSLTWAGLPGNGAGILLDLDMWASSG